MTKHSLPVEIDIDGSVHALTFSANSEYLVAGGANGVRVWRMEDGRQMATMKAQNVQCLAVSRDDRWIAAGIGSGKVLVWDVTTYEQVSAERVFWHEDSPGVNGVDFSPDSTRLVAAYPSNIATVWDVATCLPERTLLHDAKLVIAAKYSPQGDRIATASTHIRVWDSNDDSLFVDIPVTVIPLYDTGLLWFNNCLFVVSDNKIQRFDVTNRSAALEWPVPNTNKHSCIALPKHGKFIAYSTNDTITFWNTSTHSQLSFIRHPQDVRSIALSPNNKFLAIGGKDGRISIESLFRITNSITLSRLHPTLQEPDIQIDDSTLDLWKNNRLKDAEALLTRAIHDSLKPSHHVLASRALVRARLGEWDTALVDAEMAIKIQPSVISYIAKSIAHVGKGERDKGYQACDLAFEHFHSSHITFLLLIKAIIIFKAGEHVDAISRMDNLIATIPFDSIGYVVQAYMWLLLGDSHMEHDNYEDAMQSFERARAQTLHRACRPFLVVTLIFGWRFDDLDITIRQRLCEALYAAGRIMDAVECFRSMENELEEKVDSSGEHTEWALDFKERSFKKLEQLADIAIDA